MSVGMLPAEVRLADEVDPITVGKDEVALEDEVRTDDDFVGTVCETERLLEDLAVCEIEELLEDLVTVAVLGDEVDPVIVEKDDIAPEDVVETEDMALFGADIDPMVVENDRVVLEDEVEAEDLAVLGPEVDFIKVEKDEVALDKELAFGGPKAMSTIVTTSVISTTVYPQVIVKVVSSTAIVSIFSHALWYG